MLRDAFAKPRLLAVGSAFGLLLSNIAWANEMPPPTTEEQLPVISLQAQVVAETIKLDLPTVIRLVEEKNLDVALTKTHLLQAKGYVNDAVADLLPSIRAQSYVEKLEGGEIFIGPIPFPVDRITYQPRISADYQIPLGGRTLFQIQAAKFQYKRVLTTQKTATQKALRTALSQYFTLQRNASSVELAELALKEAAAQLAFNQSRFDAGFATKLDVLQSESLLAERKGDLLKAQNARLTAAVDLSTTLDLPLDVHIEPENTEIAAITYLDPNLTLQQLYATALQNRPDLKELAFQIEEAKARYRVTRSDLFPTLSLSGYKRGVGPKPDELQKTNELFASISLDLLRNLGFGILASMQVDKGRIQEAILNREKQLNEAEKTLAKAFYDSQYFKELMAVNESKVKTELETYRVAGARLKTGIGINLELVQAQKDLTEARRNFQDAVMNYNIAQVGLLYETGQLTPHSLQFPVQP